MKRVIKANKIRQTTLWDVKRKLQDVTNVIEQLSEEDQELLEELTNHTFYEDLLDAQRYIDSEINAQHV